MPAWLVDATSDVAAIRPARVGIVGCGDVTNLYLPGSARFPSIELAACTDLDAARAQALAARGGFPAVSLGALLADPSIEIVLNLTPPAAHAAVTMAAIAAGKHVYSEKPLATTRADGQAILDDAAAARVVVGGAPDTFLGGGLQTARALIDEGAIGEPLLATATVAHEGPERWHPNPAFFYERGGGPLLDVGPYYIAALASLLGPLAAVSAVGRGLGGERRVAVGPLSGQTVVSAVPTSVVAAFSFESGVVGGLTASFDVVGSGAPHLEIHGTAGSLQLGDPNRFDGEVRYRALGADGWEDIPLRFDVSVGRGIGLADLIGGIRAGRPPRASGAFAFHVLDVLLAIESAAETRVPQAIASTAERPAPLPPA
jgi:predicted dehydrogenase